MTSWITSSIGIAALLVGSVLLYLGKITWEQFTFFLGLFGIGLASKDFNVTGGTKERS